MEARKTEIAMGNCIKNDIERVGEEWKQMIENIVKEKENGKGNHGQLSPDYSDAK